MILLPTKVRPSENGFTIVEVLVSALLIGLGLGSILAIDAKSIRTLRATRQAAAGSQMLQQRIEAIRAAPWPGISSSTALARLLETPTESEAEIADPGIAELLKVTVPNLSPALGGSVRSLSVRRQRGTASVEETGDFSDEPTLLFESTITWRDSGGSHQRHLRTIVNRAGLTRSGIFGSVLGRPSAGAGEP